jgi:NAD(P)-dependent dehydrogenase (short-subunit alcohol dehydrogenase family)
MSRPKELLSSTAVGLGQGWTRRLASDGFDIAVSDLADASDTRAIVDAAGRNFITDVVDVTSPESTRQFANDVGNARPPITALVNNSKFDVEETGGAEGRIHGLPVCH